MFLLTCFDHAASSVAELRLLLLLLYLSISGSFKDPALHAARLADMEAKCNLLCNGAVTGRFRIEGARRIVCLECNQCLTPYTAYHPDCLRKHFVRRHTVRHQGQLLM